MFKQKKAIPKSLLHPDLIHSYLKLKTFCHLKLLRHGDARRFAMSVLPSLHIRTMCSIFTSKRNNNNNNNQALVPNLGLVMIPQQASQGLPHDFFSTMLLYTKGNYMIKRRRLYGRRSLKLVNGTK